MIKLITGSAICLLCYLLVLIVIRAAQALEITIGKAKNKKAKTYPYALANNKNLLNDPNKIQN